MRATRHVRIQSMFTSLGPGAIGIDRPFPEAAELAAQTGFDGIGVDLGYLRDRGPDAYREVLDEHGLRTGSMGVPVDVTGDEDDYAADLDALPEIADAAAAVGVERASTYILSFSDERPFEENVEFHRDRLEPVAGALADRDIRLGLEFLGPETIRAGHEHEFVHDSAGMLELCEAVGENVGLLLDSWHWYTAGGSRERLASLTAADVVDVHVNDAPAGVSRADQVDSERRLPGATGVIPIEPFVRRLDDAGYDGPVMAEPFSDDVAAMADADAARATLESIESVLERAGV